MSSSFCAHKAKQTTIADITEENRLAFENAGYDVEAKNLPLDLNQEFEKLEKEISENSEWDTRVAAIKNVMGYINSGACENDDFVHNLIKLYSGLSTAITNLRSTLMKQACLLVSQLARELGPRFSQIGDYLPPLSTRLSHGTQVISESSQFCIISIVKNCHTKQILYGILELAKKKGNANKETAAECMLLIFEHWSFQILEPHWSMIESCILQLLSDASVVARSFARQAVRALMDSSPQKAEGILSKVDQRTRNSIEAVYSDRKPSAGIEKMVLKNKSNIIKPRATSNLMKHRKLKIERQYSAERMAERSVVSTSEIETREIPNSPITIRNKCLNKETNKRINQKNKMNETKETNQNIQNKEINSLNTNKKLNQKFNENKESNNKMKVNKEQNNNISERIINKNLSNKMGIKEQNNIQSKELNYNTKINKRNINIETNNKTKIKKEQNINKINEDIKMKPKTNNNQSKEINHKKKI